MDRIDHPTADASVSDRPLFTEGNPATGLPATVITAEWLNGVQEEMIHAISSAGLTPNAADLTQLTQAVRLLSAAAPVRQPTNLSPSSGATGVNGAPTLQASPYYSLYGVAQGGAKFEISTSQTFSTITHSATINGAATSYAVPADVLTTLAVYWWRASYRDVEGVWSAPSVATAFTSAAVFAYVAAPTNTAPAAGATGVSPTPTLTSSAFAVTGGADAHAASRWRISSSATFATVSYDSGVSAALTSLAVPISAALTPLTPYYFQVCHQGATLGWSDWSTATAFVVEAPSGERVYDVAGSYEFEVPAGVYKINAVGAGAGGGSTSAGGGGGGLRGQNNIAVVPGQKITVTVGAPGAPGAPGGSTSFGAYFTAYGGQPGSGATGGQGGGGVGGDFGGRGGDGGDGGGTNGGGGGGAGGYGGNGGKGGNASNTATWNGSDGSGGGGGGGNGIANNGTGGGGGGVGLNGKGENGVGAAGGLQSAPGAPGSNGVSSVGAAGGKFGGGAGGHGGLNTAGPGGLRITWGPNSAIQI
jgi:hypothetical protein